MSILTRGIEAVGRQRFYAGLGEISGNRTKKSIAAPDRLRQKRYRGGVELQIGKRGTTDPSRHDHACAATFHQLSAGQADGAKRHIERLRSRKNGVSLTSDPENDNVMALIAGVACQIFGKTPLPRDDRQPRHVAPYLCAA